MQQIAKKNFKKTLLRTAVVAALCGAGVAQAATIVIQSRDPAGVGFNDTTPVAPVGGNPGTTLGEQRMFVYRYVADVWEKALDSDVTITVSAAWEPLTCTASSATLGSASAWNFWYGFQGGASPALPARARRRAWRMLAQLARDESDEARAHDCERAAAAIE